MKRILTALLILAMVFSLAVPAIAAPFEPGVTYTPTVTPEERTAIHAQVDALVGDVGDAVVGDGSYHPLTLVGAMLDGSNYDSISGGSSGKTVPTAYPFPVGNESGGNNRNEYDRKVAKLAWVVELAENLGFPVVVQRQHRLKRDMLIGDLNFFL